MKKWSLVFVLALGMAAVSFAGGDSGGKDGKNVRAHGHACYWSEPGTFSANLVVPNDQEDGGK